MTHFPRHLAHGLAFAIRRFVEFGAFSFIMSAMVSCMNGSVNDQSRV